MKKQVFQWIAISTMSIFIFACNADRSVNPSQNGNSPELNLQQQEPDAVPNEILVKFKKGVSDDKQAEIIDRLRGKVKEKILTKLMEKFGDEQGITLLEMPIKAFEALSRVKDFPEIEYAEPNYIYTYDATSNDPLAVNGSLWGMVGDFGCKASVAWANNKIGSNDIYVGIIDEGFMFNHEDITDNAGTIPGEIADNGKDDDGNGYVDDYRGWDFANNDKTIFDGTGDDHGTHVAGTIGGKGGNSKGVAGVCWNVKLLSGKFLGSRGGTTANAIKAVDYFTDLKIRHGLNIVATNNSWGGGGFSQALQDAIERANAQGILFIAAAGNASSNNDATSSYPSNYPNANVIAVASIASDGTLSSFSNYGATQVDLGAPGTNINSSLPNSSGRGRTATITSGYGSYSGTSMATPHVSGAAALYKSINPTATAAQIKAAILNSVTPTPSLSGKTVTGGRLNVSSF